MAAFEDRTVVGTIAIGKVGRPTVEIAAAHQIRRLAFSGRFGESTVDRQKAAVPVLEPDQEGEVVQHRPLVAIPQQHFVLELRQRADVTRDSQQRIVPVPASPNDARIDHQRVAVGALQMQHAALAVAGQHFRQGLPGFGTLHGGVQFKQFAPDELVATTQASSGCRIEVAYATFEVQDEHQIRDGLKQAFQVLMPGGHSRTRRQALPEPLELAGQTAQHRDGRPQQPGRVTGAADRCWTDAHPGVTQGYGQKTAHFSRAADLFLENNRLMILTGRSERKLQRPSAECRSCRNSGQSRILTRTAANAS
jgi:hypothetical protein